MRARLHKTRHDADGERFAVVEIHDRACVVERAGSEFTIEEALRVLQERGVAEDEALAMLRSARIAFWHGLSHETIAATLEGWTVH
jgi:hypothetical protein